MTQLTLAALVEFSLRKSTSPLLFQSLVQQLNHKQEIQLHEIKSLLTADEEFSPLKVIYITTASLSSQSSTLKISNVLTILPSANDMNQFLILNAYISELRNDQIGKALSSLNNFEIIESINAFITYIKYLMNQRQENVKLYEHFATLLNSLVSYLPNDLTLTTITQEQNDIFFSFINELKSKNLLIADTLEETFSKLSRFARKSSVSGSVRHSITSFSHGSLNPSTHSSFIKTNKLPKFIWLNSAVQRWETHRDNFITSFEQFVKVKTNQNILNDLLATSFEGYIVALQSPEADSFFLENWRLFLLKRLTVLIKSLNMKNVESSLTNAFNLIDLKVTQSIKLASGNDSDSSADDIFASFPSTTTDIRHDFLRDCISSGLLSAGSFSVILKQDAAADNRPLPGFNNPSDSQDIQETLNQVLFDINTEFTSLEDSNLLDFLSSIKEMQGTKQQEVSQLIVQAIVKFTSEDNSSQLHRLSLGLGLVKDALHVILFHVSPNAILKPLMNYLDTWEISNDEMNFQDAYSSFGGIFLLFLLIVKRFNISLDELISLKPKINDPSFCISYISKLGTCSQINSSDSYKSEVLTSWINALFDSGGISDDLMRVSTAQECFDIFPCIFQQAFIGCKQNIVDVDTIKGGLEYFLQPFLVGTTVGIFSWAQSYLWKHKDINLLVNLLKSLINPSDLSGESIHLHKIVLAICGPDLFKSLSNIDKIITKVDAQLLSSLQEVAKTDSSPNFFEVRVFTNAKDTKATENTLSILEVFHNSFFSLLNWNQTTTVPNFDYQRFSNFIDFLGPEVIVNYLIDQITISQSSNAKNFQILLEISTFILTVHFIGTSRENNTLALHALKHIEITDNDKNNLKTYSFLKVLIKKKKESSKDELYDDIFKMFYDKIYDTVHLTTSSL